MSIDLYGTGFQTPGGLCSVDLDGTPGPGGIKSAPFATKANQKYTVSFLFSGNGYCDGEPNVKKMTVEANGQHERFTWNVQKQGYAQNGNYLQETWQFLGKAETTLVFASNDPPGDCGPVVAAVTVN